MGKVIIFAAVVAVILAGTLCAGIIARIFKAMFTPKKEK